MHLRTIARCLLCLGLLMAVVGPAAAATRQQEQDPYPAPQLPTADPLAPAATPAAYPPAGAMTPDPALPTAPGATPAPIGVPPSNGSFDGPATVGIDMVPPPAPAPSPNGMLYLWLGFVATLLIFAACVLGTVMLFSRRAQP
jgi:hypothetical protein